jgi:hypothetical protein
MTTPPQPIRITAESQVPFPCWLYGPTLGAWAHMDRWDRDYMNTPYSLGWTFYLPDQPERPTVVPEAETARIDERPATFRDSHRLADQIICTKDGLAFAAIYFSFEGRARAERAQYVAQLQDWANAISRED